MPPEERLKRAEALVKAQVDNLEAEMAQAKYVIGDFFKAQIRENFADIDQVPLEKYIGRCRVVHAKHRDAIRLDDLDGLDLAAEQRLLFRTVAAPADDVWDNGFTYVSAEVARKAAADGLTLIGIDTPSMDPMTSKTLDAHKALFEGGVAILESIDLSNVDEGVYELIALPLKIGGGDSSPVRAILRTLDGDGS